MKEISTLIDVSKLSLADEEKKQTPQELFSNVVTFVLLSYSQQNKGILKSERNQVYEIQDQLKENKDKITLEDNTLGFLRRVFRETKLSPNNILRAVEEKIFEANEIIIK